MMQPLDADREAPVSVEARGQRREIEGNGAQGGGLRRLAGRALARRLGARRCFRRRYHPRRRLLAETACCLRHGAVGSLVFRRARSRAPERVAFKETLTRRLLTRRFPKAEELSRC